MEAIRRAKARIAMAKATLQRTQVETGPNIFDQFSTLFPPAGGRAGKPSSDPSPDAIISLEAERLMALSLDN